MEEILRSLPNLTMHPVPKPTLAAAFAALALGCQAAAAQGPALESLSQMQSAAARYLETQANSDYPWLLATAHVVAADPRLRLARCSERRFFLPPGNGPYGSGSVGVRCDAPQPWTLYLAYSVSLRGPALTAARPLAARQAIDADAVRVAEIEYTRDPASYLRDPGEAVGMLARYPVAAGQALVHGVLAKPLSVKAGQKIRLVAQGQGFSVSQQCTALNNAARGETVRCRVPSGRILQGTATDMGTIVTTP